MKLAIFTRGMSEVEIAALDKLFDGSDANEPGFFRRHSAGNNVVFVKYRDDVLGLPPILTWGDEVSAELKLRNQADVYKRCKPKFQVDVDVSLKPVQVLDRATGYTGQGFGIWSAYILFTGGLSETQLRVLDKKYPSRWGENMFFKHRDNAMYLDGVYSDNIHFGMVNHAERRIAGTPDRFQEIVPEFTVNVTATVR